MFGYLSPTDLSQYLDGSIVLYDGTPGYIRTTGANDGETVIFYPLNNKSKGITIKITDDKFSCRNIDLGYMQVGACAVYVQRKPMRMYKQGIVRNHLKFTPNHVSDRDAIYSKEFSNCIHGQHPSFKSAFSKLSPYTNNNYEASFAFNRHFCVEYTTDGTYFIRHMGRRIASRYGTSDWRALSKHKFSDRVMKMLTDAGGPDVTI